MLRVGRCRLVLFLVLYLCISLLGVYRCLFLTVNRISERMCWEYSVIICIFLKGGRCRLVLFLVLYLCISLLGVYRCLFLTVNRISERMYWDYNVIICIFYKASLQDSPIPPLDMILTVFFCKINILLTLEDLPQKINL
jgi:hypothetical protein